MAWHVYVYIHTYGMERMYIYTYICIYIYTYLYIHTHLYSSTSCAVCLYSLCLPVSSRWLTSMLNASEGTPGPRASVLWACTQSCFIHAYIHTYKMCITTEGRHMADPRLCYDMGGAWCESAMWGSTCTYVKHVVIWHTHDICFTGKRLA